MVLEEAIKQVAEELNIDEYVVRRVYYSVFEFIKDTVAEMPLKEEFLSKEDFEKLKRVFYIPGLGKIVIPYRTYEAVWKAYLNKKGKK